jgi:hypothetical protein
LNREPASAIPIPDVPGNSILKNSASWESSGFDKRIVEEIKEEAEEEEVKESEDKAEMSDEIDVFINENRSLLPDSEGEKEATDPNALILKKKKKKRANRPAKKKKEKTASLEVPQEVIQVMSAAIDDRSMDSMRKDSKLDVMEKEQIVSLPPPPPQSRGTIRPKHDFYQLVEKMVFYVFSKKLDKNLVSVNIQSDLVFMSFLLIIADHCRFWWIQLTLEFVYQTFLSCRSRWLHF